MNNFLTHFGSYLSLQDVSPSQLEALGSRDIATDYLIDDTSNFYQHQLWISVSGTSIIYGYLRWREKTNVGVLENIKPEWKLESMVIRPL